MAAQTIAFEVSGIDRLAAVPAPAGFRVAHALSLGARRDGHKTVTLAARPDRDVVVLTVKDGPRLVLHPENARDLLLAQVDGRRGGTSAAGAAVPVPATLGWPAQEAPASRGQARGWLGVGELLSFDVLSVLKEQAATATAAGLAALVDGGVAEGIYRLTAAARPGKLSGQRRERQLPPAGNAPLLVLVHGGFVDTDRTFGALWRRTDGLIGRLFRYYDNRVYGFEHATLGVSPIANALALARTLPDGAALHLLTHSRGGMVAEILARACAGTPLGVADIDRFVGAGYADHRADLKALAALAVGKRLRVERIVRVACPMRGTLLASTRLDAYLSVLQWLLEQAGGPVVGGIADFLHAVALRRTSPEQLPGLEAMMPERPLVAWLNQGDRPIGGELRVVAGDIEPHSVVAWLKTLMADAFYWTDNDLIVQTRSMYGGFPRAARASLQPATFMLDRGAAVSHFNYFSNGSTALAVGRALTEPDPAGFEPIGPLSWQGVDASGVRAGRPVPARRRGAAARDLPAVFVLPGLLGSNLDRNGTRLWLGFRFLNNFDALAWHDSTASQYVPSSPLNQYDDLADDLAATHEVIEFPFDWRAPMEQEARRLARAVDAALDARRGGGQPVRLLAHSMGGLVARTMQLEAPATWDRMMQVPGARVLMLGTPNGGSWAPMQTLSGDDSFGNALAAVGSLFNRDSARKVMAGMPGFLQLQAGLLDPAYKLASEEGWHELSRKDAQIMAERSVWHATPLQRRMYDWPVPPQLVLDMAVDLRRRLDNQLGTLALWSDRIVVVVGKAPLTPAGFNMTAAGLEYHNVADGGDGRVMLENALLPGVRAWSLDAEHNRLPQMRHAFVAFRELLATGSTEQLASVGARTRGGATRPARAHHAVVRSRPSRGELDELRPPTAAQLAGQPGVTAEAHADRSSGVPLQVSVCNGDFRFVRPPLMLGHYRSASLAGSEAVMDRLLGGAMSQSLAASLYPQMLGAHQVFNNLHSNPANPLSLPRPPDVIVIGLGAEGQLPSKDLVDAVRQGIVAYAQRLWERNLKTPFKLAATLIGSGGTHVSVGTAAMALVQGALQANQRLASVGWPPLAGLEIVELYLDRACDALRSIQVLQKASPERLHAAPAVQFGQGALRRPLDNGYRGAHHDLISALTGRAGGKHGALITFVLGTRRARTEVTAQRPQLPLLRELVMLASNDVSAATNIGSTLFNLLIPIEIEPYLAGTGDLVIELDAGTAGLPWELLDTRDTSAGARPVGSRSEGQDDDASSHRPWAVRCKLIRKLQSTKFREQPREALQDDAILIVSEPKSTLPPLPGARLEAQAIAAALGIDRAVAGGGGSVLLPERSDAQTIINALFAQDYRLIHIAGHGKPGPHGGVVLSGDDIYLGVAEIKAMRVTPELVFLNCCHLATRDSADLLKPYNRAEFAANMADALIGAGVRCVIVAGWAVDDNAAVVFAQTFYTALFDGERFIDAVGRARDATWQRDRHGNTWAAYQCYGDPDWTFRHSPDLAFHADTDIDEAAAISSADDLITLLERICYDNRYDSPPEEPSQRERIDRIAALYQPMWGHIGVVAEAFGQAYESAALYREAERWYRAAIDADDGTASFRANEMLAALHLLLPVSQVSRETVAQGIARLQQLVAIHPTARRAYLLGTGHKLLAMCDAGTQLLPAERDALVAAAGHFHDAAVLAEEGASLRYEAGRNAVACRLRLALRGARNAWPRPLASELQGLQELMEREAAADPTFRNVAGQIELRLYEAVIGDALASECAGLKTALQALKERVPSPNDWQQVASDAEFVLAYRAGADPAERAAAQELVALLMELGGGQCADTATDDGSQVPPGP